MTIDAVRALLLSGEPVEHVEAQLVRSGLSLGEAHRSMRAVLVGEAIDRMWDKMRPICINRSDYG